MIIKRDFFKIRISSSDHKNLIPYADEVIHNEDFYKFDGEPSEHFSYCLFQANVGVLPISDIYRRNYNLSENEYLDKGEYDWECFALITNASIPYLRCTYGTNRSWYPCGGSEFVSKENLYSLLNSSKRDLKYPILAYGIGAIFIWDLEYDNTINDFRLLCSDEELMNLYYKNKLELFLSLRNTRKYNSLSKDDKVRAFLQEHIQEEKTLWSNSERLKSYPLLYEYTNEFVHKYLSFLLAKIENTSNIAQKVNVFCMPVYVSYPWSDSQTMDFICKSLSARGLSYIRDEQDCGYRQNITNFEEKIADASIVIAIINDQSLHSKDCMYEMCKMVENGHVEKRLFPIISLPENINRDPASGDELFEYWNKQLDKKKEAMLPSCSPLLLEELKFCLTIVTEFQKLWMYICRHNSLTKDELLDNNCKKLIDSIIEMQQNL